MQIPDQTHRLEEARLRRIQAAETATAAALPEHRDNGQARAPYIFNFTKGLTHNPDTGLLDSPADFEAFTEATATPDPWVWAGVPFAGTCHCTPVPPELPTAGEPAFREWESPTAGLDFVLEGPDPWALGIPPAPRAGSRELAAEMAEVYQMALHRDLPVAAFMDAALIANFTSTSKPGKRLSATNAQQLQTDHGQVTADAARLGSLGWFEGTTNGLDTPVVMERERRRLGAPMAPDTLYRGVGEDTWATPFVSQFLLIGSDASEPENGVIRYGNQRIGQVLRKARPNRNFMTRWEDWTDVQNGLNTRALLGIRANDSKVPVADRPPSEFEETNGEITQRPIASLRDLATYVHDDQLAQAYFNAALILLGRKTAFDAGLPYHRHSANGVPGSNREPFAVFGAPHLLSVLWSVAAPALRAVRATKFSVHRRARPEQLGALFHTVLSGYDPSGAGAFDFADPVEGPARRLLARLIAPSVIDTQPDFEKGLHDILTDIRLSNEAANATPTQQNPPNSWLLPMAFPEGSPMHPSYGAGHATVAGACVTVLKAFFEMGPTIDPKMLVEPGGTAFIAHQQSQNSGEPELIGLPIQDGLTLRGELNKLAWNISNARNVAGVHCYSDYIESLLLGEAVALGILREQMLTYHHGHSYGGAPTGDANVSMTVPLFTRRHLPASLLFGADFGPGDAVAEVVVRKDGTLGFIH